MEKQRTTEYDMDVPSNVDRSPKQAGGQRCAQCGQSFPTKPELDQHNKKAHAAPKASKPDVRGGRP